MRFDPRMEDWRTGLVAVAAAAALVAGCTGGGDTEEAGAPGHRESKPVAKAGGSDESAKGTVTTASGLKYEVVEEGDGATPGPTDRVTVHYRGTLTDGTEFDSSYKRGQPAVFPVNRVIPGWTEALQLMQEGDKWKLTIPPDLAYGQRGAGRLIGPNETLLFEVELIEVSKAE